MLNFACNSAYFNNLLQISMRLRIWIYVHMNEPEGQFWLVYVIFWARHSRHVSECGPRCKCWWPSRTKDTNAYSRHAQVGRAEDSWNVATKEDWKQRGMWSEFAENCLWFEIRELVMWKCDVYIRSGCASALVVSPDGHQQLDVRCADSSEAEMQSLLRVCGIHNPLISCGKSTIHVRILVSLAVPPGLAWAARFDHVIIIFPEVDAKVDCGYSGYRSVAPSHAPQIHI